MGPKIDLELHKQIIEGFVLHGINLEQIPERLLRDHGIKISIRTLKRSLQQWNIKSRIKPDDSEELDIRIALLYYNFGYSDKQSLEVLQGEGVSISSYTLVQARKRLGIYRRVSVFNREESERELRRIVQEQLDLGTIESYGRGLLHGFLRNQGCIASRLAASLDPSTLFRANHLLQRDRIFSVYRELNPAAIQRRTQDLQRHRGEYIVPGPDFVWSVDGYCKLQAFGIEIYAAIDAYSRYVTWIYVGITARTAISVLRQYLDTIQDTGYCPRIIRSDRGTETTMCADAHFKLSTSLRSNEEIAGFEDAYWYGTSTANQRIESWWAQLSKGSIWQWRVDRPVFFTIEQFVLTGCRNTFKNYNRRAYTVVTT
jgi:hypothetical protein